MEKLYRKPFKKLWESNLRREDAQAAVLQPCLTAEHQFAN